MSKLVKLEIRAYPDADFKKQTGKVFKAQFNPAEISLNWSSKEMKIDEIESTAGKKIPVKVTDFSDVTSNFKLIFDNTMSSDKTPILRKVGEFRKACVKINPEAHAPNFVKLNWGEFALKCQLTALSVNFTLFSPEGIPLRAELSCEFKRYVKLASKFKDEDNNSPDMTRVITIKEGDSLPLLCHEHYGSTKYYLQVAKSNSLISPLNLEIGQQIVLPPLVDDIAQHYR